MSQSVKRAARIIDSITHDPKSVAQLAEEFDLHRSTIFRELQSLEEVGYVRRRSNGTYSLGYHLLSLAQHALDDIDVRQAAYEKVRTLHKVVGNTVHVAALVDSSIMYVDKVEDAGGVRMYSRIGAPVIPHCSGVGKAILSRLDTSARDRILEGSEWQKFTEKTITTRAALDVELEKIAVQGWAADDGEFESFVNCVAVPIRTPAGVVGALSVTAIRMVEDLESLKAHIPLLQRTAGLIAHDLR